MKPSTATDVVVIGAGAVGLACALYVAERGLSVMLLDRGLPGTETTTTTGGGVRLQFDRPEQIRLSQLSWPFWESFAEDTGVDPGIRRIGYLFLARTAATAAGLRRAGRLHAEMGAPSELLEGEAIVRRWPELGLAECVAAAYAPTAYFLNHFRVVQGLCRRAARSGVSVLSGTTVRNLCVRDGRVVGVATATQRFDASVVVNAAGPWCDRIARTADVDLPLVTRRLGLMLLDAPRHLPSAMPWLFDLDTGLHVRPDAPGLALAGGLLRDAPVVDADDFERRPDPYWCDRVLDGLAQSYEWFDRGSARVARSWCGLYSCPADMQPIIELSRPGLVTVAGFGGSGLMHAPAAGLLASELIVDGATTSMDIAAFSSRRFAVGGAGWTAAF